MVDGFADHAAGHDGLHAGLIRDVASDLHQRASQVASLTDESALDDAALHAAQDGRLDRFADHLAACTSVLHDLSHHRRAS